MSYANGQYPLHLFIHRGGNLYFTPSLNARWNEMVRLGVEKYGVRLFITGDIDGLGGWNAYRPIGPQRNYRRHYGIRAAEPGFSSHGGKFRGQEVFALDISNVNALAPGNQSLANARLTALARAVGLTVNFVTPTEWWHVGDFNPAWTVPSFGAVAVNPDTTNRPTVPKEDDDMLMLTLHGIGPETHKVALGPKTFRHFIQSDPYEKIKNLARIQDDWQDVSYAELPALLRTYGCDLNIWDWNPSAGGFCILDPLTGSVKPGNVWTAENATRAAIAGIQLPTLDPAPIVAAVKTALAKGIQLDEKAIAKAVNDDAARRLVS